MSGFKIEGLWPAALTRIKKGAPAQLAVGVGLGLVVSLIDCTAAPKGTTCDVRTPVITVAVFGAWIVLVVFWNVIVQAPRDVARAAISRAQTAESALGYRNDRRRVRDQLAALAHDGDQAWNAASSAYQMWWDNEGPVPLISIGSVTIGPPQYSVPEWWKDEDAWLAKVEAYLSETPELGSSYVDLFRAQDASLPERGLTDAPLSTGTRTKQAMHLIRTKQERLREFMKDFKG